MLAASAGTGAGVDTLWAAVEAHRQALSQSGEIESRRRDQARAWMWSLVDEGLQDAFRSHPTVAARIPEVESAVAARKASPAAAARALLEAFHKS